MIIMLGSFFAIFLVLWALASGLFLVVYPALRHTFFALHPRAGSALLLAFWAAPFLVSVCTTLLLFLPDMETVLVDAHCHAVCESHVPLIQSWKVAAFGLVLGSAVLGVLALWGGSIVLRSFRLHQQFGMLSQNRGAYDVLQSSIPLVFTLGWWKSRIYVSEALLSACSPEELGVILLHEASHKARRDNLRLLFARLCLSVLGRPRARRMMDDLHLLTEQACDSVAAEQHGPVLVAETLLKVKRLMSRGHTPHVALAFAEREVEIRIRALLATQQRPALAAWQFALLAAGATGILAMLVRPLHHGAEWAMVLLAVV